MHALFQEKLEKLKCNTCLAITEVIYGTSKEKLCQEFGLESLDKVDCCL